MKRWMEKLGLWLLAKSGFRPMMNTRCACGEGSFDLLLLITQCSKDGHASGLSELAPGPAPTMPKSEFPS